MSLFCRLLVPAILCASSGALADTPSPGETAANGSATEQAEQAPADRPNSGSENVPHAAADAPPVDAGDSSLVKMQPGKGISIESPDGAFLLRIRPRIQLRYDVSGSGDTFQQVFNIRRARLTFSGHLFGPDIHFRIELALSPRDMRVENGRVTLTPITDIFVVSKHLRDFSVRGGQFKVPYSRQRVVSSGVLQMVDRSLAQGEFNLDRDVGVHAYSDDLFGLKLLRYAAGVFVGEGRDVFELSDFGLMVLGRVEVSPLAHFSGEFGLDKDEVDLARSARPKLTLGLAYAFLDEGKRNRGILGRIPADGGTTDTHNMTADLAAKWMGMSLFLEGFARVGNRNPGGATDDDGIAIPVEAARQGVGGTIQAGVLLPFADVEVSARYSGVRGLFVTSITDVDEVGAGLSWYIAGHSLKLQGDVFQQFTNFDVLSGRAQMRVQLQAAF